MSQYNEQFLKQNPLAILGVLRDLHINQVPLRVSWPGGQFISKVLDVSPEKLVFDFGSQQQENIAVQKASNITITAETQGAKVEFTLAQIESGEYLHLPAFFSPLPSALWFVQRREYFRICAPSHPVYYGTAQMPDNSVLHFRLFDLSLGGMGALLEGATPAGLTPGICFTQLVLNMGEWGRFRFDAQLISVTERKIIDGKNETVSTPRLSFRFLNVGPGVERELQRIIYSLEREAREKSNKVRD